MSKELVSPSEINVAIMRALGISTERCASAVITLRPGESPVVVCEYYVKPFTRDELGCLERVTKSFDLLPRERS